MHVRTLTTLGIKIAQRGRQQHKCKDAWLLDVCHMDQGTTNKQTHPDKLHESNNLQAGRQNKKNSGFGDTYDLRR